MLSKEDYTLAQEALDALAGRQPGAAAACNAAAQKLGRDELLDERDKGLLVIALVGHAVHAGTESLPAVERIAGEFGMRDELMAQLEDWIAYAEGREAKP